MNPKVAALESLSAPLVAFLRRPRAPAEVRLGNVTFYIDRGRLYYDVALVQWDAAAVLRDFRRLLKSL